MDYIALKCIRLFEDFVCAYVVPNTHQVHISIGDAEDTVTLTLFPDRQIKSDSHKTIEVNQLWNSRFLKRATFQLNSNNDPIYSVAIS